MKSSLKRQLWVRAHQARLASPLWSAWVSLGLLRLRSQLSLLAVPHQPALHLPQVLLERGSAHGGAPEPLAAPNVEESSREQPNDIRDATTRHEGAGSSSLPARNRSRVTSRSQRHQKIKMKQQTISGCSRTRIYRSIMKPSAQSEGATMTPWTSVSLWPHISLTCHILSISMNTAIAFCCHGYPANRNC